MTEQKAIRYGEEYLHDLCCAACKVEDRHKEFVRMSIKALEEIQQYRALGTVNEIQGIYVEYIRHEPLYKQYNAIGTPEECRAAVEKLMAKKPIIKYKQTQDCVTEVEWKCPICGTNYVELAPCGEWCRYCGQKFDWSDEE